MTDILETLLYCTFSTRRFSGTDSVHLSCIMPGATMLFHFPSDIEKVVPKIMANDAIGATKLLNC